MKKISYILCVLGVMLIIIAIIFVFIGKSTIKDIPWNVLYEKGTYNDNNIVEYDSNKYNMVIINQNSIKAANAYGYYVPSDLYLSGIYNYSVLYKNDKISVIRNTGIIREDNVDFKQNIINQYESNSYVNLSGYQLKNGSMAYLLKILDNNNYVQKLILYVKSTGGYYKIEYSLENMKFSKKFLSNVIEEKNIDNKNKDKDGVWNLMLDVPGGKHFSMQYDLNKYQLANELSFEDYMLMLRNNNKLIKIMLLYDVDEKINQIVESEYLYTFNDTSDKKIINGYLVKTYYYKEDIDYTSYTITIDSKTMLLIITPSDSHININDFMNFTFE